MGGHAALVGTDRHILRRRPGAETNAVPVHGTLLSARHYVHPRKAKRFSTPTVAMEDTRVNGVVWPCLGDGCHGQHNVNRRMVAGLSDQRKPNQLLPWVVARGTIQESELPAPVLERYRKSIEGTKEILADE